MPFFLMIMNAVQEETFSSLRACIINKGIGDAKVGTDEDQLQLKGKVFMEIAWHCSRNKHNYEEVEWKKSGND